MNPSLAKPSNSERGRLGEFEVIPTDGAQAPGMTQGLGRYLTERMDHNCRCGGFDSTSKSFLKEDSNAASPVLYRGLGSVTGLNNRYKANFQTRQILEAGS